MARKIEQLEKPVAISLSDGEIAAPAAALMTLFTPGKSFGTKLLRQLVQTLSASLLQSGPLLGVSTQDLFAAYDVPTQVLLNCLGRWEARGWVKEIKVAANKGDRRKSTRRGRNTIRYELSSKGVVWLMSQVARCESGLKHIRVDLMLLSILVARSFPLKSIGARKTDLDKHFGMPLVKNEPTKAIKKTEWDWRLIRNRFVEVLTERAESLEGIAEDLEPAAEYIEKAEGLIERSGLLERIGTKLEVKRRGLESVFLWDGVEHELPDDINFFVPGLFAFANQRDDRSIEDMGLLPLANFYKQFDPDFVRWHLFEGIEQIRTGIYAANAAHIRGVIEVLVAL